MHNQKVKVSASIELMVTWKRDEPNSYEDDYTFVGSITFEPAKFNDNENIAGVAKAEAIKNAAKEIGQKFGRNLNPQNSDSDFLLELTQAPPKPPSMTKAIKNLNNQVEKNNQ